jgi:RNA recognition motif-containing protein
MSRKRDRSNFTRYDRPAPYPKRRRPPPPPPPQSQPNDIKPSTKPPPPPAVVVVDLPPDCSVLDLKSRFAIYGEISRTRIDRDAIGYITYRSKDSAEAAITASLDSSFGIAINSKKVTILFIYYSVKLSQNKLRIALVNGRCCRICPSTHLLVSFNFGLLN